MDPFVDNIGETLFWVFIAGFTVILLWELLGPRRPLVVSMGRRWWVNGGLLVIDNLLTRFLVPVGAVGVAVLAREAGWGLLPLMEAPFWLAMVAGMVALDLAHYAVHRALHTWPLLWRFHRVHHLDPEYDLTTGVRFHPLEAVTMGLADIAVVAVLGVPPEAAALMVVLLMFTTFFTHANAGLPAAVDRPLRRLLVTPDMHRIHHSADPREGNSNYGSVLSIWDRWFGSYTAEPRLGHTGMRIGLSDADPEEGLGLATALSAPFRRRGAVADPVVSAESEV